MKIKSSRKNTTNQQNCIEFPIKLLKFILNKLKIKELFKHYVKDKRSRCDNYEISSLLMNCLFTHIFRCPSKNHFYQYFKRSDAARAMAKFTGSESENCPCIRTIDDLLLNLNPEDFLPILPGIFHSLCRQKVFQLHPELIPNNQYAVAVDGQVTHTYHDHSQHPCQFCPYCLKRTRGDKVWYIHFDLVASFVAPNGLQIPLLFHRIRARPEWGNLSENMWKQECERTALPFLLRELRRQFPRLRLCIHMDALHATDPNFTLLKGLNMDYSIVRKAKVLTTVGKDCAGLKSFSPPIKHTTETKRFKIEQEIHFYNDVKYQEHNLSIIELDERAEKKPSKRFAKIQSTSTHWEWIVSQKITEANVVKDSKRSRIRWKQEEMFNDVQRRGFYICHDFNRSPNSQTIRMYLIYVAYAICSILTHSTLGKAVLAKGYTILFMMQQMLTDLISRSEDQLFAGFNPIQLRFAKDPPV